MQSITAAAGKSPQRVAGHPPAWQPLSEPGEGAAQADAIQADAIQADAIQAGAIPPDTIQPDTIQPGAVAANTVRPGGAGMRAAFSGPARALGYPPVAAACSFAVFILAWWGVALWNGNAVQLPGPPAVLDALRDLADDGELLDNAELSFLRLLISMAVATALALPLGFAMGLSERARAYIDPTVEMLRPISGIAWIPLALFIFGVGDVLPVFIMAYVAFFPLLLNTMAGVRGTDPRLIAAARTMGVGHSRIVLRVVVPAALPMIMVGVRLAFAGAWAAIIAAELIGAPSGLGFAIEWYRELLASPKVFAYIGVIAAVGYACDLALQVLQRRLTPWTAGSGLA